jgi:hypothetical protein
MAGNMKLNWLNALETFYLFFITGLSIYFTITILFLVGHRDEGFSEWYIILYGGGALLLTVYFLFCAILSVFRIPDERSFDFGFTAERDNYRFLSSPSKILTGKSVPWIDFITRFVPHIIFAIFTLALAGAFGAVYPVPNAFDDGGFTTDVSTLAEQSAQVQEAYSVSPLKQAYFISVPVGFVEEGIIMLLIEVLVLIGVLAYLILMLALKKPLKVPAFVHIILIVIATFIASIGYSAIVPGFTDAHSAAYQANMAAYAKAFVFEFTGQLVNQFTGVFLSWIPHAMHNFIVSYFMIAGLAIGGTALGIFWLAKVQKRKVEN